jgi:hypothetical protein
MPCKNIYALYRGEEYIMDGTIPELAEKTGYKRTTLYWLATPTAERKRGGRKYHKKKPRIEIVKIGTIDELDKEEGF